MKEIFIISNDIDEIIKKTDKIVEKLNDVFPLDEAKLENEEVYTKIDSFIFRVSKLQDLLGAKFFKYTLIELLEYEDNMSMIDILNKLEQLGILEKKEWIRYRNLRNFLTHIYPNDTYEIEENLKEAIKMYDDLKIIYNRLKNRVFDEA